MKFYSALLVFILCASSSFGQTMDIAYVRKDGNWRLIDKKGNFITEKLFEHDSLFKDCTNEGMILMEKGYKYGFIDLSDKHIIPAIYDSASHFVQGYCEVKKGDTWFFIDRWGKIVRAIETLPDASETDDFDSLAALVHHNPNQFIAPWNNTEAYTIDRILCYEVLANKDCSCHKMTNYYGFINRKAEWVIPANYEWADIYSLGMAAASQGTGDGMTIGYIDIEGKWAIQPVFQDCGRFRTIKIK